MDSLDKLEALGAAAQFDVCGYCGEKRAPATATPWRFIHRAALPGGGAVSLMKVLLTSFCVNDCSYCVNQIGRDSPRFSFQPEELARLFMQLHQKRMVKGLFLSSGISPSPTRTMEAMVKTVDILRRCYQFKGYVHLKILPGASFPYIEEACKLADRVSVNMEAPTAKHLAKLSSKKDLYQGILEPMRWVKKLIANNEALVPSGQTTQFVVGAAGETDQDILHTSGALYREMGLRRVYFSAFQPVTGSRLQGVAPTPRVREHRLYQADWLLRIYSFSSEEMELALGKNADLSLTTDPKLVIARKQPWLFPVDINRASYDQLLRVPGIGPTTARRIIEVRKDRTIHSLEQMQKMGAVTKRAAPFVWLPGMRIPEKQASFLPLLEADEPAQSKPLAAIC